MKIVNTGEERDTMDDGAEGFEDLLVNPPDNWTWCLGSPEHPICPECSSEMDYTLTVRPDGTELSRNTCSCCGYETEDREEEE